MADLVLRQAESEGSWNMYAARTEVFAEGTSPRGAVSLTRGPGIGGSPEEIANGAECWTVFLRGSPRIVLPRLCTPWYYSRWSLARGVDGELDGVPFRLSGRSALRPSRRAVVVEGAGIDVRIIQRAFSPVLMEQDEQIGLWRSTGWELLEASDLAVMAACLFEWTGAMHFIQTPVIRQL
ncbi:hypothetical protein ACFRFJ_25855 [Streptomyces hydrogenans]|uniref:hypothetical protein n=1 Tax=Streptomyces hydrogenans TaxID=1873719 RepID=UPI0036BB1D5F